MKLGAIAKVTGIVAALGAVGGAIGGAIISGFVSLPRLWTELVIMPPFWAILVYTSFWGAAAGIVLGPILAWTLLRRAPLWRAVTETALATAIGVGVVFALSAPFAAFVGALTLAPLAAALRLRHEVRERRSLPAAGNGATAPRIDQTLT